MKKQIERWIGIFLIAFLLIGQMESYVFTANAEEIMANDEVEDNISTEPKSGVKHETTVKGAANWEQEDNNTLSTANPIALNTTYYGVGEDAWCYDYYKIMLPSDGVVSVTFNHALQDYNNDKFNISIKNSSTSYEEIVSRGYDTSLTTSKVGLSRGTYYIRVYTTQQGVGLEYNFKVNYAASSVWEREDNDTYSTANPIALDTVYYGVGEEAWCYDYYKITLPSDGVISVTFNHAFQDYNNDKFEISIKNPSTLYEEIISRGYDTSLTTNKIGLSRGTYYIRVYTTQQGVGLEYNFKVNYAASSVWEKEDNGAFSKANPIALNTTYHGNLSSREDNDYYTFTLQNKMWTNFYFEHNKFVDCSESSGYAIELYNSSGKKIEYDATGYKVGTLTSYARDKYKTWSSIQLNPGKYYLVVNKYSYDNNMAGKEYKFTLEKVDVKAPKIKTIKSKCYNSVGLTWTKVSGVEGYYIYRSTSKNKGYGIIDFVYPTQTSYTDTGLTCGKKYYYKVSAITYAGSYKYKASKPQVVKPTLPTTKIALKSGKKGQIKLTWNRVKGASGYEIYRSTASKGKYKLIKTVSKGSICNYTNTKLKSKKTYYYKVRAYRKVNGKKVYSKTSTAVGKKCK